MKQLALAPALCILMAGMAHASVEVPEHLIDPTRPQFDAPERVVERFFSAVGRGELVLHGRQLDRSQTLPRRVEYRYDLAERTTQIKLFVDLTPPLPMPGGRFRVMSVDVVMDGEQIVEIESHIWVNE